VGLIELFVAVLVAGISVVNAALPLAAWARLHDGRFLILSTGNALFAVLGALWIWGSLPGNPPAYAVPSLPALLLAFGVTVLILASAVWSRRT
jgi:hypothetical protein